MLMDLTCFQSISSGCTAADEGLGFRLLRSEKCSRVDVRHLWYVTFYSPAVGTPSIKTLIGQGKENTKEPREGGRDV
jgi:hypothetical protein